MPGLPRLKRDVEAQTPISVHRRLAIALAGADDHLAAEILVAISEPQCLPLTGPRCGDATAPYDMVTLHLKDIGEIGPDRDLQIKAYRALTIIGDVDVLMQPAIDMAADHQAPSGGRKRPRLIP